MNTTSTNKNYANVQVRTKALSSLTGASQFLHYPTACKTGLCCGISDTHTHTHTH